MVDANIVYIPFQQQRPNNRRRRRRRPRRGMTILIVLGIVAMTLALSYAMMRSQAVNAQLQANRGRQEEARQAAMAGMSLALRKMHEADWKGVDTTLSGNLSSSTKFEVLYATGDPSLEVADSDYADYPYRVTLTATGYSQDPADPAIRATHQIRAVVQLIRRNLAAVPDGWGGTDAYTIYQWDDQAVTVNSPVRTEGKVHLQGALTLCNTYPPHYSKAFDGTIDEVAIFNEQKSESQISWSYSWDRYHGRRGTVYADLYPDHWWKFSELNGSTTVNDSVGSWDGIVGGVSLGSGYAEFDGHDDEIDIGKFNCDEDEITIFAWFKADSFSRSVDGRIISKATGTAEEDHYWMLSTKSWGIHNRLRFRLRIDGVTHTLTASSGNLQAGTWYFAAATYDGLEMRLYLNGVEVGSHVEAGGISQNSNVPVFIGNNPPGSPKSRYLRDLEKSRTDGNADNRLFGGDVDMVTSRTDDYDLQLLKEELNNAVQDISSHDTAPVTHPGTVETYQLYPGGKVYDVILLGTSLSDEDLGPDPLSNPLGVFRTEGEITFLDGVSFEGTLITEGNDADVEIKGTNISIKPMTLDPLEGETAAVQLPVAIVEDDFHIHNSTSTVEGAVIAWDEYKVDEVSGSTTFAHAGKVISRRLLLLGRSSWDLGDSTWLSELMSYVQQIRDGSAISYFPQWMEQEESLAVQSSLTIKPNTADIHYHWQNWNDPIYAAHPNDEGLVWDLIEWTDSP